MKKDYFALVDEGNVILFTSLDNMKEWLLDYIRQAGVDIDVQEFLDESYNRYGAIMYWTDKVAVVK